MISKIFFLALIAVAASDPVLCPVPSAANNLVAEQWVHEDAPEGGRVEKVVTIPTGGKIPSCIVLTGDAGAPSEGQVSISAIGLSEEGAIVKLVSTIKNGIDHVIQVYTE